RRRGELGRSGHGLHGAVVCPVHEAGTPFGVGTSGDNQADQNQNRHAFHHTPLEKSKACIISNRNGGTPSTKRRNWVPEMSRYSMGARANSGTPERRRCRSVGKRRGYPE